MTPKHNKVFVTGDLHLGDAAFRQEDKLIDIIKAQKPGSIIFGGDTFDPWRGKSIENIVAKYDQFFKFLQGVSAKVVFIEGNHDPNIAVLKKLGFSIGKNYKYHDATGRRIKVIHGHEFDNDCQRWEFLVKKMVLLEEWVNKFLIKLDPDSRIRFARLMGNIDIVRIVKNFHRKVRGLISEEVLMFGHLHVPWIGEKKDLKFYNWGGWQSDYGFKPRYILQDGPHIKMQTVK